MALSFKSYNMKNRIDKLIKLGMENRAAFDRETNALVKRSEGDKKLKAELRKEFQESLDKRGEKIKELAVKIQLDAISDMINMSYIAKTYFGKSRQWLYHRINGSTVNGKRAEFTPEQKKQLNAALKDIGKKIGSVTVL